jgi:predicted ArsR family transcriptional regulator
MTLIGDEIQELISGMVLPPLEDNDITINELSAATGLKENSVRNRMKHLVESGTWQIVWKRNATGGRVQTFNKMT